MKKLFQTLVVLLVTTSVIGISSCNKELDVLYNMPDYEFCIPAQTYSSSTGLVQYFPLDKDLIKKAFDAASADFSEGKITSAKITGITLKTSEAKNTLSAVAKGVQGYIVNSHANPLDDKNMVASTNTNISTGATEIELSVSGIDLTSLLASSDTTYLALKVWNVDNSPAACVKLTKGVIKFNVKK